MTVGEIRLTSPNVRVVRADTEDLEVQTANPDLILWDMTRVKHKWPKFEDAPFLWLTFISWAGARRLGLIPADHKWETWRDQVLDVADVNQDNPEDELGTPTPAGLGPA